MPPQVQTPSPAPQVQTPAPQVQTPAPQVQTPVPQVQTPATTQISSAVQAPVVRPPKQQATSLIPPVHPVAAPVAQDLARRQLHPAHTPARPQIINQDGHVAGADLTFEQIQAMEREARAAATEAPAAE